jgi:2-keto-4-pentenoate hydratase/2-oxohepta-3-ene-1,7-dioic acid hydratase in catechol pathway
VEDDIIHLLAVPNMLALIEQGRVSRSGETIALKAAQVLAPIPRPRRNVLCIGKNYHEHAQEFTRSGFDATTNTADAVPENPIVFTKFPETVIASGELIRYPQGLSSAVDYEAEIGVVIGKTCRGVKRADALKHVFGYTLVNDVTARDLQKKHQQWFMGKSLDTFCPMGPAVVTADALRYDDIDVQCRVNGELRQSSNTKYLIFDIPTLIETISAGTTLLPGDIISTGTPVGVGIGFSPPKYLKVGDVIEVRSDAIGLLSNRVG